MDVSERIRRWVQQRRRRLRVGFAGDGEIMDLVVQGYKRHSRAIPAAAYHPDRDRARQNAQRWGCEAFYDSHDRFLSDVEIVEYGDLPGARGCAPLAVEAIEAGVHVSFQRPRSAQISVLEEIAVRARRRGVRARVNDPFLFYPPYGLVKELLDRRGIGEPSSLRIKVTVGRGGAWPIPGFDPAAGPEAFLSHPCLDRFSLALYLFGEVERVAAYVNAIDPPAPEKPGQAVVILMFRHPGRFGVLDLTLAPEMEIRSDYYPVHEIVEIAGTDGIIWANHCVGTMTQEPPIVVRGAKSYYQIGVERGLEADFSDAFAASASDLIRALLRKRRPRSTIAGSVRALKVLAAAVESARARQERPVA